MKLHSVAAPDEFVEGHAQPQPGFWLATPRHNAKQIPAAAIHRL
jgi:hypothetical protein